MLALLVTDMPIARAFLDDVGVSADELSAQRAAYSDAMAAARKGDWARFERLQASLHSYPLAPYLEYTRLMKRLKVTGGSSARQFVDARADTPLGVRYLGHYLDVAGRDRRWGDYLAAATSEPRAERLRCYHGRALRGRGREDEAWDLASRLWLSGRSVDKACDPLFRLWQENDQLTNELVWDRAGLAYGARQSGLLRYVASLGDGEVAEPLETLRRSYREPHRTRTLVQDLRPPYRADVLALGLERHSRYDPARALQEFRALDPDSLSSAQKRRIEAAIAYRGLIERDAGVRDWVDAMLPVWRDDKLTEMRLRWAIREQDWVALNSALAALSDAKRADGTWLYWQGRTAEVQGDAEQAEALFSRAASQRSYYGFLAADRLGLPYSFRDSAVDEVQVALGEDLQQALLRVHELQAVDEPRLAQTEWTHALQRTDAPRRLRMAQIARDETWHRLTIDAANAARAHDALSLRFPLAYVDDFRAPARRQALPLSELMAIARRESAFFPDARSSVGARGLMQLMPATGKAVARASGVRLNLQDLYAVEQNIDLGSAYYRQLLDRFDGNRAVALAAYNAGPNRVQHWIGENLPIDAWIETIPYRETRDYVKAVLAYSVVFDYRLGREARLLSVTERQARY